MATKEQYDLKKEQAEKERLRQLRSKKNKKIMIIFLPTLLIIGGIVLAIVNYSPKENQPGTPKIEINPLEYDAGNVSMAAGLIKYTYEIKNIGDGDLKIDSVWTSCHCTTARLTVNDKTSPEFGMNKRSTLQKIAPEQTGFLEVTFDPAFHGPQGTGLAIRAVYLSTNDSQNKKVEVRLVANVVK